MGNLFKWLTVGWLLAGIGLALFIQQAAPASHGLPEVGIGEPGFDTGIVYISGKRFDCSSPTSSGSMHCTLPVAGDLLEISVQPQVITPRLFEGQCTAQFRGQTHACGSGVHRGTSRSIAIIPDALGLSAAERDDLSASYPIENMVSVYPHPLLAYTIVLTTLVMLALVLNEPRKPLLPRAGFAFSLGVSTVVVTHVAWTVTILFMWD